MTISASTARTYTIPAATRLGHVHYIVADRERQIRFYRDILGFKLHWQADASAGLGAGGEDLLRLTEQRGARHVRRTQLAFITPPSWCRRYGNSPIYSGGSWRRARPFRA